MRPAPDPAGRDAPRSTRAQWEELAESWDRARRRPWESVAAFASSFGAGERVLDLAAGNGRHGVLVAKTGARVVAADQSRSLLSFAKERGLPSIHSDAGALPFRSASFDGALFVAGLHCVPRRANRLGALAELRRVLRPGARALVTVWSRFREGTLSTAWQEDADVPWGGTPRTYHFYTPLELVADCRAAGFEGVRLSGTRVSRQATWLPDNWFVYLRA